MEDKLQEIINDANENLERDENKVKKLRGRIEFCQAHNFKEEERIAFIELNAIEMIVFRYRNTINELGKTLDAWNS